MDKNIYLTTIARAKANFETKLNDTVCEVERDIYMRSIDACERLFNNVSNMNLDIISIENYKTLDDSNEINILRTERLKLFSLSNQN